MSFEATGLCHSDHHVRTGDLPIPPPPMVGGHEGAGIVQEVGPGRTRPSKAGDHVVASFLPACGRCRWCASGQQNMCDLGALVPVGTQVDGTYRRHARGRELGAYLSAGHLRSVRHRVRGLAGQDRRRPAVVSCLPGRLRSDHGLGFGGQHRRREPRRHGRGDRLRRSRQRRHSGRAAGRRGEDHRRRYPGDQARQGLRIRRNPLRDIDAGGQRTRRRADPWRDGGFGTAHRRAGRRAR